MSTKAKKSVKNPETLAVESLQNAQIVQRKPAELLPWEGNPRTHSEKQLVALMASIKELGFRVPIITNEEGVVLAGHGRLEAAKRLELVEVPTIVAAGLNKTQQRAFVVADNKLASMSTWDKDLLLNEIEILLDEEFHVETTGFSTAEIDIMIDGAATPEDPDQDNLQAADVAEEMEVTKPDDLWRLDDHRIFCGDSTQALSYGALMKKDELAQMCITDPPYNVPVNGHVCGSGKTKHPEFVMASGEMNSGQFTDFLARSCANIASYCQDGAIVYLFMDWRHMREILNAGEQVFGKLRQLCVWGKDNAGMGTFYRSQHELIFAFKHGQAPHINNFELGQYGRYRSNVWSYPGVNTFTGKGFQQLALHPTVKPVSLIADAIRDCSNRGGIILDPFAGSGTILIAAERTGRIARAIEYESRYVDVAIRRWQRVTGKHAIHTQTGMTFQERSEFLAAGGVDDPSVKV